MFGINESTRSEWPGNSFNDQVTKARKKGKMLKKKTL